MNDITVTTIEGVLPYSGPHAIPGIKFRGVGRALGISAWGMNVLELGPDCSGYPEHDHSQDGQEEAYLILSGEALLVVGDQETPVKTGTFVRVPPVLRRKFVTRDQPVSILAIGGTPGQSFKSILG